MGIEDIDRICNKLGIQPDDIKVSRETWSFKNNIRAKHKRYYIELIDGRSFYLKMNALDKTLREKSEIGYDLMVE